MSKPILEALFGSGARAKVMSYLYLRPDDSEPLTTRLLAREAEVPYGSISKTLHDLADDQLIVREESPDGPRYRAPHDDPRLAGLFLLVRQDSVIVQSLKRALKPFAAIEHAAIFGSFAAGTTHRKSDIDLLILERPGLDRFAVMAAVVKVAGKAMRDINPEFYATPEFAEKLDKRDPVALGILANPRIDVRGRLPWQT